VLFLYEPGLTRDSLKVFETSTGKNRIFFFFKYENFFHLFYSEKKKNMKITLKKKVNHSSFIIHLSPCNLLLLFCLTDFLPILQNISEEKKFVEKNH